MESFTIVHPEHLNHYGYLFGGQLLKWVDEIAWLAASRDYPGCNLVTRGMDRIDFTRPVKNGSILRFVVEMKQRGKTSVVYSVKAFSSPGNPSAEETVFSTRVIFVRVDENGNKIGLENGDGN